MTEEERQTLEQWAQRVETDRRLAVRARMVLDCAQGLTNRAVAAQLRVSSVSVEKWRERFLRSGLEGLADKPRSRLTRNLTDAKVKEIITRALESKPTQGRRWTTRRMADVTGLSRTTISSVWRAFGLQPHQPYRSGTFKLTADPFLGEGETVRDIAGLYLNPPDRAVVLCVEEKGPERLLYRASPMLHVRPGVPEHPTQDSLRRSTASMFAALDTATRKAVSTGQRWHRSREFLRFLERVDGQLPPTQQVHIVMDNYRTPRPPTVKRWFTRHPRYRLRFTVTRASWPDQMESLLEEITHRRIRQKTLPTVQSLEMAIHDYLKHGHPERKPFVWTATADLICHKIK